MNHWATLLLLEPRIYTFLLSRRFYIEGKISSTVCIFGVHIPSPNHISSLETCLKSVYSVDTFQGSITPLK